VWDDRVVQVSNVVVCTFSLSANVTIIGSDISFKLTMVYGPTHGNLNDALFAGLVVQKPPTST
jgi:hypothetical protein